ncbi:copper amine oxidase N-terminal domain-containing protein [Desulforamulus ferrireducens]|uniref:Copper amine oxidase n=1 Tax=Desulforamulus ferrireducens TaxID=1833852 RepID=A0A1S6IXR5_9FIRM|nr:copper amine oxidase N-terminal domain-containing protein [Desulforamulus ferrireducens]AQS59565.1 copper amine oxidase [Desulforamulus ferrireducens]
MKKLLSLLSTAVLVFCLAGSALAAPVKQAIFYLNQSYYQIDTVHHTMDAAPFIENNRTYVPIRYLSYACGLTDQDVVWDEVFQTIKLSQGDKVLQLQVNIDQAIVNDLVYDLDVAPVVKNGRTYLPARFIAESLGFEVTWDEKRRTVLITPTSK